MSKDKQISLTDLTQLKKIMAMTTSANDGEVLNAIRIANRILANSGLFWAEVLGRTVTSATMPFAQGGDYTVDTDYSEDGSYGDMVKAAFDELRGVDLGDFRGFVDDVERTFIRTTYLSPAQRKPIFDAVKRHREKTRRDE